MARYFSPIAFSLVVLLYSCAGFDLIDDIADFTTADIAPRVDADFGDGTEENPFLLDLAETLEIELIDQRDPEANRSLNHFTIWQSSNTDVAAVDNGRVLGVGQGDAIISAFKEVEGDDRLIEIGQWSFEVFEFERIVISSASGNFAALEGRQLQLSALYYDDNNAPDATQEISWESDDSSIASVSDDGLVSALDSGTVAIRAQLSTGEVAAEINFQVLTNDVDVFSVVIQNQIESLTINESIQLTASAYSINNVVIEDEPLTWRSESSSVIEVNASGLATAMSLGSTRIFATASGGVESDPLEIQVTDASVTVRTGSIVSSRGGTTGTVTLFIDDDDQLKLRLNQDFFGATIPGPELFLSNSSTSAAGALQIAEVDPGDGNDRVFVVPGNPGINDFDYVLYHCVPFNIIYGAYLLD